MKIKKSKVIEEPDNPYVKYFKDKIHKELCKNTLDLAIDDLVARTLKYYDTHKNRDIDFVSKVIVRDLKSDLEKGIMDKEQGRKVLFWKKYFIRTELFLIETYPRYVYSLLFKGLSPEEEENNDILHK